MNKVKFFSVVICVLVVSSCASTGSQIGSNLALCCPGNYGSYKLYGLEVVDMPLFLRAYVTTEFAAVFDQKGLRRNDQINDVKVLMSYKQIDLVPGQQGIDPLVKDESSSVELSYIARIEIEIIETQSGGLVWAGSLSRVHRVSPGEYMHEERARPYFYKAFESLLASYPILQANN